MSLYGEEKNPNAKCVQGVYICSREYAVEVSNFNKPIYSRFQN